MSPLRLVTYEQGVKVTREREDGTLFNLTPSEAALFLNCSRYQISNIFPDVAPQTDERVITDGHIARFVQKHNHFNLFEEPVPVVLFGREIMSKNMISIENSSNEAQLLTNLSEDEFAKAAKEF